MSELQSALAGAIGHCLHAAVISVSSPVEDDLRDARVLCLRRQALADLGGLLRLLPGGDARVRDSQNGPLRAIVDELRVDVLDRAIHHEARTFRRAAHLLADAQVPLVPLLGARLRLVNRSHYLAPALPAFRRICSP